jgi:hypothetical protein
MNCHRIIGGKLKGFKYLQDALRIAPNRFHVESVLFIKLLDELLETGDILPDAAPFSSCVLHYFSVY